MIGTRYINKLSLRGQFYMNIYLHEVVCLADELHVSVLDPVVDHLDEVAAAVLPHPVAAGLRADLRADSLQYTSYYSYLLETILLT